MSLKGSVFMYEFQQNCHKANFIGTNFRGIDQHSENFSELAPSRILTYKVDQLKE